MADDPFTLEQYMVPESYSYVGPKALYDFHKVKDMSSDRYVSMLMTIHREDGYASRTHDPRERILGFSITGGYCRNHMLGVQTMTDIDVVYTDDDYIVSSFDKRFTELPGTRMVRTFQLPDNTLHLIPHPYVQPVDGVLHTFINPARFDFTVNLGCISAVDGWLYAPPVTLFDIQNKILRPCALMLNELEVSSIMELSVVLRAIRFSLKYDMSIHESLLRAMDVLFALHNHTGRVDDTTLYYVLKHVDTEDSGLKNRYYEALRSLHFIDTDKYASFDDYYKYITERANCNPRFEPVEVHSLRSSY